MDRKGTKREGEEHEVKERMEESGAEVLGERENEGKTFDSSRQLEFIFQFT